jgi:RNA polymerase sigma-70 factor (ECF subfamily)
MEYSLERVRHKHTHTRSTALPTLSSLFDFSMRRRLEALRPRLYRLAYAWSHDSHLAEDLAQEALFRAMARSGQLKDAQRLESWVFAILNNCWRDHLRQRREYTDIEDLDEAVVAHDDTPECEYSRRQTRDRVRGAVARLPLGQRQVLTLVDIEACSYAEVANVLAIPVGTVMSRLARARQALRSMLAAENNARVIPINRRFQ